MEGVNLRRLVLLIMSVLLLLSICGCDTGLKIVGIEIEEYPDRIVYFSGTDNELDLSGGAIYLITKDNMKDNSRDGTHEKMIDKSIEVIHNIDFNKPGVYVVELKRGEFICKFPIQVIDKDLTGN